MGGSHLEAWVADEPCASWRIAEVPWGRVRKVEGGHNLGSRYGERDLGRCTVSAAPSAYLWVLGGCAPWCELRCAGFEPWAGVYGFAGFADLEVELGARAAAAVAGGGDGVAGGDAFADGFVE